MKKQYIDYILGMVMIICIWTAAFLLSNKMQKIQKSKLKKQFIQTQKVFRAAQKLRYDRLIESAYLLAENSTFKANLELNDPASVKYSVSEFSRFMKIDIFIVVGQNMRTLAKMGLAANDSANFGQFDEIKNALQGMEPDLNISWPNIKMINNQLYHIVSVPVYAGRNKIIGAILLGTKFSQSEIGEIRSGNTFDVSFIEDNKIIASSSQNPDQKQMFLELFNQHFEPESLEIDKSNPFIMVENFSKSQQNIAFISPMGKGEKAYYMCSLPQKEAMEGSHNFASYCYLFAGFISFCVVLLCLNKEDGLKKVIKK